MSTPWRYKRSWSEDELEAEMKRISELGRNFEVGPDGLPAGKGWSEHYSEAQTGLEAPGLPERDGVFERTVYAVSRYQFSDPSIVTGHFDPDVPLLGRKMLLELRALGLHFLCGTEVTEILEHQDGRRTLFGFRYDTLEDHIESGVEWFLVKKDHATGRITFRIQAYWRRGEFPNLWSKLGFFALGRHYQEKWHRQAHLRLRECLGQGVCELPSLPRRGKLIHEGPLIEVRKGA